ncbi:MAG: amino acid racemase [Streptosporangiaceae bacterium]
MDHEVARRFAGHWLKAWNSHDLEAVLSHFSDDVVFSSPMAAQLREGCDGVVQGKAALRDYWAEGLRRVPELHFEIESLYVGVRTLVINYRNQAGGLVNEVLVFDGALVVEGHGTYLVREAAEAAGAARLRVIGMLGGMSWESTAEYYRLANELVRERLGGLHSARLVLASVDFAEIEQLQVTGRWEQAAELLAEAARSVEAAGAELLLLCTNTMHKVAGQVQDAVSIPLLHLADATAAAVRRAGLTTVGLLGTAFTMEQDFYRDRLASHGLTVLVPPAEERAEVHRVIYDELCLGQVREASRQAYRKVIAHLAQAGAEGVILGCTEIELLVGPGDSPVPVFSTTRLHVEAAVEAAIVPKPAHCLPRVPGISTGA